MNHPEPAARPAPDPTWVAFFAVMLTAIFPGAGHALLRDWARAGIWAVGWFVVAAAGGGHSVALVALAVVASFDVYFRAKALAPPPGEEQS